MAYEKLLQVPRATKDRLEAIKELLQNYTLILYKFARLYFTNSYFVKYQNAIFWVEKLPNFKLC